MEALAELANKRINMSSLHGPGGRRGIPIVTIQRFQERFQPTATIEFKCHDESAQNSRIESNSDQVVFKI